MKTLAHPVCKETLSFFLGADNQSHILQFGCKNIFSFSVNLEFSDTTKEAVFVTFVHIHLKSGTVRVNISNVRTSEKTSQSQSFRNSIMMKLGGDIFFSFSIQQILENKPLLHVPFQERGGGRSAFTV